MDFAACETLMPTITRRGLRTRDTSALSTSCDHLAPNLVVSSNHAGGCARYCRCDCSDQIGSSSWSDPIFRPFDEDAQQSQSLISRTFRVVGTLLNAP